MSFVPTTMDYIFYKLCRNIAYVRAAAFVLTIFVLLNFNICNSVWLSAVISFVVYYVTGGYKYVHVVVSTLPRDVIAVTRYIALMIFFKKITLRNLTISKLFAKNVSKYGNEVCFLYENEKWTFQQVDDYSNQIAQYFHSIGYKPGDVAALYMDSRPQYVCIWLGLSKIGCVTALINSNLRLESLRHSIQIANCRSIILGPEKIQNVTDSLDLLSVLQMEYFLTGTTLAPLISNVVSLDKYIAAQPKIAPQYDLGKHTDLLLYIYTSGTTGMPKSAKISHMRYALLPSGVHYMFNLKSDDVIYDSLPLYHTAGGNVGIGQALLFGSTVAIRKKFSASNFWEDCIKFNVTAAQYIGEMCRYLLSQPLRPVDRSHKVKKIFGNGLRPQLWRQFVERFNIGQVGEYYGATEGNTNIMNINNKEGSVGFVSKIIPSVYPVKLIRIDENGEPVRDEYGMCIISEPGEIGEFVGKISQSSTRRFEGYLNEKDTMKKIVKNVVTEGDVYFRSGDLLMADDLGYMYFKDRLGDTFRWKGENVSTSEVESIVSRIVGDKDCVVYGVEVPGTEGKAGMAAIVDPDGSIDIPSITNQIENSLPSYARPLFIRLLDNVDTTGTFKLKKEDLKKQGFTLNGKNNIFFLNTNGYVKVTQSLYDDICSGKVRL